MHANANDDVNRVEFQVESKPEFCPYPNKREISIAFWPQPWVISVEHKKCCDGNHFWFYLLYDKKYVNANKREYKIVIKKVWRDVSQKFHQGVRASPGGSNKSNQ